MDQYMAFVMVDEGVMFHISSPSRAEIIVGLGRYVAGRAPDRLWPRDAARVARWLQRDRLEAAVTAYFHAVGHRWDPERLQVTIPPGADREDPFLSRFCGINLRIFPEEWSS